MNTIDNRAYFFDAGIRFACQRCGDCCTGAPGIVRVSPDEVSSIAGYLATEAEDLKKNSLIVFESGYRIREVTDGRCIFFDGGCHIYPVRPRQCRTFPFWISNLRSESRWRDVSIACPGIGSGRMYTKAKILDILSDETSNPDF